MRIAQIAPRSQPLPPTYDGGSEHVGTTLCDALVAAQLHPLYLWQYLAACYSTPPRPTAPGCMSAISR